LTLDRPRSPSRLSPNQPQPRPGQRRRQSNRSWLNRRATRRVALSWAIRAVYSPPSHLLFPYRMVRRPWRVFQPTSTLLSNRPRRPCPVRVRHRLHCPRSRFHLQRMPRSATGRARARRMKRRLNPRPKGRHPSRPLSAQLRRLHLLRRAPRRVAAGAKVEIGRLRRQPQALHGPRHHRHLVPAHRQSRLHRCPSRPSPVCWSQTTKTK
jgi:hypothetical protein